MSKTEDRKSEGHALTLAMASNRTSAYNLQNTLEDDEVDQDDIHGKGSGKLSKSCQIP